MLIWSLPHYFKELSGPNFLFQLETEGQREMESEGT